MAKEKFDRSKQHPNIGTIGQIDHGKTTLTATITKHKAQKEQFNAENYDQTLDAPEEEQKGITINSAQID